MLSPYLVAPLLASALLAQPCAAYPPSSSNPVYEALVDRTTPVKKRDLVPLLAERATVKCAATTDCAKAGYALPKNSHYACNKARGVCTFGCNSGYVAAGSTCAKVSTTTTKAAITTKAAVATTSARPAGPTAPAATPVLKRTYAGAAFFDQFTFFSAADPTHGSVTYLTREAATAKKLVSVSSSGTAVLQIDRTSKLAVGAPRNSVRIESKEVYQPGSLIILDLKHAPVGPSVWPAFWMYNYPWPESGEVDILEGVNSRTFGQYTLHTAPGCTRNPATKMTGDTAGVDNNCNSGGASNGCTVFDRDPSSYGAGFNKAGGGVFAVLFAETGISIWRWQRSKIPSDIKNGAPRWKTWGTPVAAFDGSTCDTRSFFRNQQLTFDITTCGDWAGNQAVWQDASLSGPVYPKYKTCAAANADPAAFPEAYFEVNYLKVFGV
ncbi:hypothetical protein JCM10450v2_004252 [Rhodotorula kratochvilovae]